MGEITMKENVRPVKGHSARVLGRGHGASILQSRMREMFWLSN